MNESIDDILRWLQARPYQDNPRRHEQTAVQTYNTWDEWIDRGRRITDFENGLNWILKNGRDPVNRSTTALALGFVGGDRSFQTLITSLKADVPIVAMEAATSLGRLGISKAIGPLCEAINNADPNVRASACTALGTLGGENALSCLENAEKDKNAFVQSAAKEALLRINGSRIMKK